MIHFYFLAMAFLNFGLIQNISAMEEISKELIIPQWFDLRSSGSASLFNRYKQQASEQMNALFEEKIPKSLSPESSSDEYFLKNNASVKKYLSDKKRREKLVVIGAPPLGLDDWGLNDYHNYIGTVLDEKSRTKDKKIKRAIWISEILRWEESFQGKPILKSDLGQKNCQQELESIIKILELKHHKRPQYVIDFFKEEQIDGTWNVSETISENVTKVLLYGTSQGSATVLNYIARLVQEKKMMEKIIRLILEIEK